MNYSYARSFVATCFLLTAAPWVAHAQEKTGAEAALDLTLRSSALAQPMNTADGSVFPTNASHVFLFDPATNTVLAEKAGGMKMYPSSMTKIMTLYLVFEKLKQGALTLSSQFTVSEKAWRMQGSKMFVPLGGQIGLEELIRGIAIQSGNDACVVVAEGIAGSEAAFAQQMNEKARALGMTNTNFVDASGWPSAAHVTTAYDLAALASSLIRDFPEYYHYLSEREFTYHGIRQFNRNLLLGKPGLNVDGLKTGHTEAAGYGITLSAKDPASGRRLVLVINGLDSEAARAAEGERLLSWGMHNFDNLTLFKAGNAIVTSPVWMGEAREVAVTVAADSVLTIPKVGRDKITIKATHKTPLIAPVAAGQEVGTLIITFGTGLSKEIPLVAAAAVPKLGFFGRIPRALGL